MLVPIVDRMVRVGLRTVVLNIPPQDVITRDNVPARVNAVTYFRIIEANRSVVEVEDYEQATSQLAQTTLRSILGKAELDTLLAERERLNADLQQVIDEQTEPWGIKVTSVEIKDVEIPGGMQRAIARQAEAERERRAKIINAEGEFQASAKLADAADVISRNPVTIQLRYLQTLLELGGGDQRSTVVFPLPIDLLRQILEREADFDVLGEAEDGRDAFNMAVELSPDIVLLDLSLLAKQVHWNVVGPRFRSVHLQLDDVVTTARQHSDTVAERAAALSRWRRCNAAGCQAEGMPVLLVDAELEALLCPVHLLVLADGSPVEGQPMLATSAW